MDSQKPCICNGMNEECSVCGGSGFLDLISVDIIKTQYSPAELRKENEELKKYNAGTIEKFYETGEEFFSFLKNKKETVTRKNKKKSLTKSKKSKAITDTKKRNKQKNKNKIKIKKYLQGHLKVTRPPNQNRRTKRKKNE